MPFNNNHSRINTSENS